MSIDKLKEEYPKFVDFIDARLKDQRWMLSHWLDRNNNKVIIDRHGGLFYEDGTAFDGNFFALKPQNLPLSQIEDCLESELKEMVSLMREEEYSLIDDVLQSKVS